MVLNTTNTHLHACPKMVIKTLGYEPKIMVSRKTTIFWSHDQENTKELFFLSNTET